MAEFACPIAGGSPGSGKIRIVINLIVSGEGIGEGLGAADLQGRGVLFSFDSNQFSFQYPYFFHSGKIAT